MAKTLAVLFVAALLGACSSHTETVPLASAAPARATTNALAGTPMATYGHALNKAKHVQDVIDQSAAKQDAAINAATGSTSGNP